MTISADQNHIFFDNKRAFVGHFLWCQSETALLMRLDHGRKDNCISSKSNQIVYNEYFFVFFKSHQTSNFCYSRDEIIIFYASDDKCVSRDLLQKITSCKHSRTSHQWIFGTTRKCQLFYERCPSTGGLKCSVGASVCGWDHA